MSLPVEIVERILLKCDGKTLLTAKYVDDTWRDIVLYIGKRTRLWEWCCKEEIPPNEFIEYLEKYCSDDICDKSKWLNIYSNWTSWKNLSNISFQIDSSPVEIPRISCIAVAGEFIAVGSEDGRIRLFTRNWAPVYNARHLAVSVNSLTFIDSDNINDLCIVAGYNNGLNIFCFDGYRHDLLALPEIKSYSIYQNYICYEKYGGRMTISKLIKNNNSRELKELWFSRIYSPNGLSSMNMWNGVCTFLINNVVETVDYLSKDLSPMNLMTKKTRLKFSLSSWECVSRIIRSHVVVSLYSDKSDKLAGSDFIEFFILNESNNQYSQKLFNTWDIFMCFITCIYVYGNTLILGVDIGNIYFYHVSCWKNLDLRLYDHKLIIGKHPIVGIDVKETEKERKFYVSSRFNIHVVSGLAVNF